MQAQQQLLPRSCTMPPLCQMRRRCRTSVCSAVHSRQRPPPPGSPGALSMLHRRCVPAPAGLLDSAAWQARPGDRSAPAPAHAARLRRRARTAARCRRCRRCRWAAAAPTRRAPPRHRRGRRARPAWRGGTRAAAARAPRCWRWRARRAAWRSSTCGRAPPRGWAAGRSTCCARRWSRWGRARASPRRPRPQRGAPGPRRPRPGLPGRARGSSCCGPARAPAAAGRWKRWRSGRRRRRWPSWRRPASGTPRCAWRPTRASARTPCTSAPAWAPALHAAGPRGAGLDASTACRRWAGSHQHHRQW